MKKLSLLALSLASLISLSAQASSPVNFPAGSSVWKGTYTVTGSNCTGIAPAGNNPAQLDVKSSSQDAEGNITFSGVLTLSGFNNKGTSYPDFGSGAATNNDQVIASGADLYPIYMSDIGLNSMSGYNDTKPSIYVAGPTNVSCVLQVGDLLLQK